ncbi:uncharacterized protein LOC118438010 [Folsomia candida]|uniref:Uncharacterized protein n=1 Tax=Folsomia candida TaxID=158441 RepID=A0A226DL97_FOLCA|nr:uncharacterized protein LOC118438010 [Folsomia candida]OXA44986.1 hypothetical protein Fcan01_19858 [Folsomia candida]
MIHIKACGFPISKYQFLFTILQASEILHCLKTPQFYKMFAKYFLIAVLLVAGIQAMSMNPEEKIFFTNIPTSTTNQTLSVVPASCLIFGILCPTGYTGPRGG